MRLGVLCCIGVEGFPVSPLCPASCGRVVPIGQTWSEPPLGSAGPVGQTQSGCEAYVHHHLLPGTYVWAKKDLMGVSVNSGSCLPSCPQGHEGLSCPLPWQLLHPWPGPCGYLSGVSSL